MKLTSLTCLFLLMTLSISPLFQVTDVSFAHDEDDDRGAKDVIVDTLITVGSVGAIVAGGIAAVAGSAIEEVPVVGTVPGTVVQGLGVTGILGGVAGLLTSGHNLLNDIFHCEYCEKHGL